MKITTNWWIGFSDQENEGIYVTKYFATGEPSGKSEHCLEPSYQLDMKLNDRKCEGKAIWEKAFQPICQISFSQKLTTNYLILIFSSILIFNKD